MGLRQVGMIFKQVTVACASLKGHHLLVHQHSKALINTHHYFKKKNFILFQTTDCMLSTTMPYHATAQKSCKNKNSFSCGQLGYINFGNKNDIVTFLSNWS